MKKNLVVLLTYLILSTSAKAQYVNIPDANFKDYLMMYYPGCFNGSGMLDTTCSAIVNETVFGPTLGIVGSVANWDGFQYFKNLMIADFSGVSCTSLPDFPNTLKILNMPVASSLSTIPSLPNGLTHLTWTYSIYVINFPALPNSLVYLDCSYNYYLEPFTSLPTSLRYLNCQGNYAFTSLPALPASLDTLICEGDSLTSLPTLPSTLKFLNCDHNSISSLPALPPSLKYLDCGANQLTALPSLPSQLEYLAANNNMGITAIPTLPNTLQTADITTCSIGAIPAFPDSIRTFSCGSNNISLIPAFPPGMKQFDCSSNHVTTIPSLPEGLTYFGCSTNQIATLPLLPQSLTRVDCHTNLLTSLPSLPGHLSWLDCHMNQLTSLPPLPAYLTILDCSYNHIYFLPALPDTLSILTCQDNNITCFPVIPTSSTGYPMTLTMDERINCLPNLPPDGLSLTVWDSAITTPTYYNSGNQYPLCSAVNNVHHCDAFPLMTGHVYYDNNNNLIKDANEPYKANAKIQLSNGAYTMTNSNGYYQIPADSIGSYTITITAPNYFTSAPLQYSYNFNSYDTLINNDFALQATISIDSLTISVLPINWAARPGFSFPYLISYQNAGTTTLSPNITFNYDNSRVIYDSSSNASVTNNASALSLSEPGLVAGEQKSFVGYFTVKPTALIGDSVRANASIAANAISAHDTTSTEIRGSYDPNDKTATPALSPSQVANGNYIYYSIRFQNTGTDTAFNIVITDTLNNQLQAGTLQVVNTSHPAKISVEGNVVYFEFINILLPDSNVNEMKSHGYVTFRIKPQSTVTLNSSIPNKAAIYFDYNSPVLTNTAITNIAEPQVPVPLKLISFSVQRSTGDNANAYWKTFNEINVQSYNIEMSIDGRNFTSISYEKAKGYQYNDYIKTIPVPDNNILYFRLRMTDIDGRFNYSPIVILRNNKSGSFSFFNNPVKNELNISLQDGGLKNTTAEIYNAQGISVKKFLLLHDIEIVNVRSLPAGTYYLVTEKGSRSFIVVR